MAKNYMDEKVEYLFRGILSLETMEDCRAFFEDLCTVKEITEMSRRLEAARMLDESKVYTEIAEETGLSTATISRVNRCLKYGSDGYARVLSRLAEKNGEEN
jgi:TrpR-related protein YerC/YecD